MLVLFILLILDLLSIALLDDICHEKCKTCKILSIDSTNMTCLSCRDNLYFQVNTSNCVNMEDYPSYYLNKTDNILYPCSLFNSNCYECDPYMNNTGICLSCNQGYKYNNITNECEKCNEDEFPVIISDFFNCKRGMVGNCNLYITYCKSIKTNEINEIICPDEAPIFNSLTNSCHEYDCPKNGFAKGVCSISNENKQNKKRMLFINWFNNEPKYLRYPSYNVDNSGYLLIELTGGLGFDAAFNSISKNRKRKLYFYNEEGRGLFNEINDKYEKIIETRKKSVRYISTSIALQNEYFLNFESYESNLELYNIKTGEISVGKELEIANLLNSVYSPSKVQLLKLNEYNQYLFGHF